MVFVKQCDEFTLTCAALPLHSHPNVQTSGTMSLSESQPSFKWSGDQPLHDYGQERMETSALFRALFRVLSPVRFPRLREASIAIAERVCYSE
jgi:hypothetical protein